MIRTTVALLVLALGSQSLAQEMPFPSRGERYEFLRELPVEIRIKSLHDDPGVMILEATTNKLLAIANSNAAPVVEKTFTAAFPLNRRFVSAYVGQSDDWFLVDVPERRLLGPFKAARSFGVLESGEVIHQFERDKAVLCVIEGSELKRVSEVFDVIFPHSPGKFWAGRGGKWGVVGVDGEIKVPFRYETVEKVGEFYRVTEAKPAGVTEEHPRGGSNRIGLISPDGRQVLPCRYDGVGSPIDGTCTWKIAARNTQSGKNECGITELSSGKELLRLRSSDTIDYGIQEVDGRAFLVREKLLLSELEDEPFGSLDAMVSRRVYHLDHGYLTKESYHSIEAVRTSTGTLYLTERRKSLLSGQPRPLRDARFRVIDEDVISILVNADDVLVARKQGPGTGFSVLGSDGQTVVDTARFAGHTPGRGAEGPRFFGRIPARGGPDAPGLFGFVDASGQEAIPARYRKVSEFNDEGLATVLTDDGWGVIDREGNPIVGAGFEAAGRFQGLPYFWVATDAEYILYDKSGEKMIAMPKRFRMTVLNIDAGDRLLLSEMEGDKVVRRLFFALI